MSRIAEDTAKVKTFIDECITNLEKGEYAYVCDGYSGGNNGDKYDSTIQEYSSRIVSKLVSLGYTYTTNHGHGCKDWKFSKRIEL